MNKTKKGYITPNELYQRYHELDHKILLHYESRPFDQINESYINAITLEMEWIKNRLEDIAISKGWIKVGA